MVHRKTMILKQSPCQRHLVSCLDQRCTEVLHASVFIFCHHVEGRRQKLLSQRLACRLRPSTHWINHALTSSAFSFILTKLGQLLLSEHNTNSFLNADCSQVLCSHRSRPRFLDNFLRKYVKFCESLPFIQP